MSEAWTTLESNVVDGQFPLHRCLGSSDHSGVFLTEFTKREPSKVALKLVPATTTLAESPLSRWLSAAGFAHPHLIRIFEAGRCQLDGLHYLYGVMEYADQNLAQLLEHRALTEDEAREMLVPTLSALAFLHERKFVQGQLKPSNILVVGDQLKLASDTIRPVSEASDRINVMSVYDPPEARDGICSTAGDIWALGVCLSEALTRRQPSGLHGGGGSVVLPSDFPPAFREIVAWCLSRRPQDRPTVAQLEGWVRGQHTGPALAAAREPVAIALSEPQTPKPIAAQPSSPAPTASEMVAAEAAAPAAGMPESIVTSAQRPAIRAEASEGTSSQQSSQRRALPLILGAVVVLALSWAGTRVLRTDQAPAPSTAEAAADAGFQTPAPLPTPSEAAPVVADGPPPLPVSSTANTKSAGAEAALAPSGVHQEIPDVPRSASQTIRGHVRVSVRVIVDQEGTVFAALTDDPGPSRYFERLAIEAAKKWTFPPADTRAPRLMLLRFDFTREGTTARAITLP